jgi:hypothetical protein
MEHMLQVQNRSIGHQSGAVKKTRVLKTNSVAISLQANYTDWATATCQRNLVPTFVDRGVSRGQHGRFPTVVNLKYYKSILGEKQNMTYNKFQPFTAKTDIGWYVGEASDLNFKAI